MWQGDLSVVSTAVVPTTTAVLTLPGPQSVHGLCASAPLGL